MKLKILMIPAIVIIAISSSCLKRDDTDLIEMEERVFNAYIENNNITVEPTESGLYFIEETEGTGQAAEEDNWVMIRYDMYIMENSQLIYSSDKEKAVDFNIYDERVLYGVSKIKLGENIEGLDEGLMMMKEGGKARLLFKSDLGYGKAGAGYIGPYEPLIMEVELVKVIEDPVAYENQLLEEYMASNNLTNADTLESGLIYIEMEEGIGDSASTNIYVTVDVKGYLLDGRVFIDEDVFRFQLGQYDYAVTQGLSQGVSQMKESGKAKLIVPYTLGYGIIGKSYFDGKAKVPIPPYTTLIYDVELLNAK